MKRYIEMEVEGLELDYGYNVDMHIDEESVTCIVSAVYDGKRFKTVCQREMSAIPYAENEEIIFACLYDCMREVQLQIERLHEGC